MTGVEAYELVTLKCLCILTYVWCTCYVTNVCAYFDLRKTSINMALGMPRSRNKRHCKNEFDVLCHTELCLSFFLLQGIWNELFLLTCLYLWKEEEKTWTFATRRNHAHKCTPVLHFPFQTHTPFQMCATLFAHSLWFHFILLVLLTKLISYLRIFLTYLKLHCPTDTTLQRSIHSAVKFSCPWNMTILPLQLINMLHYVLKC